MESRDFVPARRTRPRRFVPTITLGLALTVLLAGCKQFIMLSYLIGGPPSIEPKFDEITGDSLTDYGARIAVVCYADDQLRFQFDKIDYLLARDVSMTLAAHKIEVVHPDRVRAWLDQNPDWDEPAEIGAGIELPDGRGITHLIYIDLLHYGLFEENSNTLYRGRAEATVRVIKMDENGGGEEIFKYDVKSAHPRLTGISTTTMSYPQFRKEYLQRLSDEIGRLFYEYYAGDDIPHGA